MIIMTFLAIVILPVRTPRDLDALALQTYILGAIIGALFLLFATLIAHTIKFEGGAHPKDPGRRRLWFWLLTVFSFASFFLYNSFVVAPTVSANLQARFLTVTVVGTLIVLMVYLAGGFALSRIFSTGKLANWFSASR